MWSVQPLSSNELLTKGNWSLLVQTPFPKHKYTHQKGTHLCSVVHVKSNCDMFCCTALSNFSEQINVKAQNMCSLVERGCPPMSAAEFAHHSTLRKNIMPVQGAFKKKNKETPASLL
jgi:hypothetical protein